MQLPRACGNRHPPCSLNSGARACHNRAAEARRKPKDPNTPASVRRWTAVWSEEAREMSPGFGLKEAQGQLMKAAHNFGLTVKASLDFWLQAEEQSPRHLQQPSTAAAAHLVNAALQEAPPDAVVDAAQWVTWLQKHLPQTSKAMHASASRQLDICATRTGILQSLVDSGKQSNTAQLEAECSAFMLVHLQVYMFMVVMPVGQICDALSHCQTAIVYMHAGGHQRPHLRQGKQLIAELGGSLISGMPVRTALCRQLSDLRQALLSMCVTEPKQPLEFKHLMGRVSDLLTLSSILWLRTAAGLAVDKLQSVAFLAPVSWTMLAEGDLPRQAYVYGRPSFWFLLSAPDAREAMQEMLGPETLQKLLHVFEIDVGYLQGLGMSAAEAQLMLKEIVPDLACDDEHGAPPLSTVPGACQPSTSLASSAGSDRTARGGCGGSPAPITAESSMAEAEDSNDMQALLRMMYGCTV